MPDCSFDEFLEWEKPIPFGSSATFLDYDGDGRLDLFVCHYVTWSPAHDLHVSTSLRGGDRSFAQPKEFAGSQCKLFRNTDGKRFEDVTEAAGLIVTQPIGTGPNATQRPVAKALGVVACDPDDDGWPDLVVANDTVRNFFFHNVAGPDGKRKFQEDADRCSLAYADQGRPRGGMGIDWGEYLPGKFAVVVDQLRQLSRTPSSAKPETKRAAVLRRGPGVRAGRAEPPAAEVRRVLLRLRSRRPARPAAPATGTSSRTSPPSRRAQKYDQPAQLFWNTGNDEPALRAGYRRRRPARTCSSRWSAADRRTWTLDGDGDLDVVLVANGGPARVLRNDNALGHQWVRLVLEGDGKRPTARRSGPR